MTNNATIRRCATCSAWLSQATFALLLLGCCGLSATSAEAVPPEPPPPRRALLIGCTKYIANPRIRELRGPRNDVGLMTRLLTNRFGFQPADIRTLLDWPDDPAQRPTAANIAAAFESLVREAEPGMRIVILLSGHGAQAPLPASQVDPLESRNPEPDGLDELFLASDAGQWSKEGVPGSIRDDQIGGWLNQLRAKGAHVWVIFDCCHSGTMLRGAKRADDVEDLVEIPRSVDPRDLGISDDATGRPAPVRKGESDLDTVLLSARPRLVGSAGKDAGSIAAFYAAQSYEEAPDLPRPAQAARRPENYYGLLTYSLNLVLEQTPRPLTYRELAHLTASLYRGERGSRSPTPMFDGDLDRVILDERSPTSPGAIFLRRSGRQWVIDAGELQGLTPGSVIGALRSPQDRDPWALFQVHESDVMSAVVAPIADAGRPPSDLDRLPEFATCRIETRNIGSRKLSLALSSDSERFTELLPAIRRNLEGLSAEVRELFSLAEDAASADFELRLTATEQSGVAPMQSRGSAQLSLFPGGRVVRDDQQRQGAASPSRPRRFISYAISDEPRLREALDRDLRKAFAWHNLWRIVGKSQAAGGSEKRRLRLEVARIASELDDSGGQLLASGSLLAGQALEVRVHNDGLEDQWVTLLFLSADLGIDIWFSESIRQGSSFAPLRSTLDDSSIGPEGFVLLSQPTPKSLVRPRFEILKQTRVGEWDDGESRSPVADPFAAFLAAATGRQATRSVPQGSSPWELHSWTWVTLPRATVRPE